MNGPLLLHRSGLIWMFGSAGVGLPTVAVAPQLGMLAAVSVLTGGLAAVVGQLLCEAQARRSPDN